MWVGVGLPGWAVGGITVGGITVGGITVGGITVATVLFGANVLFLQPMVVVGVVGVAVDFFGLCCEYYCCEISHAMVQNVLFGGPIRWMARDKSTQAIKSLEFNVESSATRSTRTASMPVFAAVTTEEATLAPRFIALPTKLFSSVLVLVSLLATDISWRYLVRSETVVSKCSRASIILGVLCLSVASMESNSSALPRLVSHCFAAATICSCFWYPSYKAGKMTLAAPTSATAIFFPG
jgi:hypothetical protein